MALLLCANRPSFSEFAQLRLNFEEFEERLLLSVSQPDGSDLSYLIDVLSVADQIAAEYWDELNRLEILANDGNIVSEIPEPSPQQDAPLPAIPFDDSIDPFTDCPGLDDAHCLPGDATQDGNVDFLDFLKLSQNFGMSDASWEDGDFDGDGHVTFQDFLILANVI